MTVIYEPASIEDAWLHFAERLEVQEEELVMPFVLSGAFPHDLCVVKSRIRVRTIEEPSGSVIFQVQQDMRMA